MTIENQKEITEIKDEEGEQGINADKNENNEK